MSKPLPDEPAVPLWVLAVWRAWSWISWPAQVRQMKRAGFRRTGWMTWEAGPSCYRSITGIMTHGPGCICPEDDFGQSRTAAGEGGRSWT